MSIVWHHGEHPTKLGALAWKVFDHTPLSKYHKKIAVKRKQPFYPEEEPDVKDFFVEGKGNVYVKKHGPRQSMAYRRRYGRSRLRRRLYGRGRRFRYRTKFGRRRRWGTRVRRAALKLSESKRNVESELDFNINSRYTSDHPAVVSRGLPRVYYRELCDMSHITDVSTAESQKTRRKGTFINATGLKLNMQLKNLLGTTPMFVRVILGYKKLNRETQASFQSTPVEQNDKDAVDIFKNTQNETNTNLESWRAGQGAAYYQVMDAPLDRHYVKVWKDYKLRLLDATTQDTGQDVAHIKCWIPFKNRPIKFENNSAGDAGDTDWWPCMWIYCCSADVTTLSNGTEASPTNCIKMTWVSTLYFRDP